MTDSCPFITSIALLAGSSYKNDDDELDQDEWCIYHEHCTACWEFLQEWWWWIGPGWMMHLSRALHCLLGVPTRMMMMNWTRMNDAFITKHCTACWEFLQEWWWWWIGPGWMMSGNIGKVGDHAIFVTLACFAWEQALWEFIYRTVSHRLFFTHQYKLSESLYLFPQKMLHLCDYIRNLWYRLCNI